MKGISVRDTLYLILHESGNRDDGRRKWMRKSRERRGPEGYILKMVILSRGQLLEKNLEKGLRGWGGGKEYDNKDNGG